MDIYFSENFKLLRYRRNVSIHKVAIETGIHKSTINNIEYNKTEPKASQIVSIANYFGVDITELLTTKLN